MFTQCEKCKAIFRVNLKEVTVAKGKLRCGECYSVFDATKTLSTSMPTAFQEIVDIGRTAYPKSTISAKSTRSDNFLKNISSKASSLSPSPAPAVKVKSAQNNNFYVKSSKSLQNVDKRLLTVVLLLVSLFVFQFFYNIKLKANEEPKHEPEKIQMITYNVFAHPNESGVLLISATMENNAKQAQPYPVIEVTLSDSKEKVIALRRFRPIEYLRNYSKKMMLVSNQKSNISLKINDPGSKATRFQYKFY